MDNIGDIPAARIVRRPQEGFSIWLRFVRRLQLDSITRASPTLWSCEENPQDELKTVEAIGRHYAPSQRANAGATMRMPGRQKKAQKNRRRIPQPNGTASFGMRIATATRMVSVVRAASSSTICLVKWVADQALRLLKASSQALVRGSFSAREQRVRKLVVDVREMQQKVQFHQRNAHQLKVGVDVKIILRKQTDRRKLNRVYDFTPVFDIANGSPLTPFRCYGPWPQWQRFQAGRSLPLLGETQGDGVLLLHRHQIPGRPELLGVP